jgi:NNMT/PNMT/TEMT family
VAQSDPFQSFPARAYLEYYYSYVGDENEAMMRALTHFARRLEPRFQHVIEVAAGPSVVPILSLCAATDRSPASVTFTDVCSKNMAEVEAWLHGRDGAFQYTDILSWLAAEHASTPDHIERLIRTTQWTLPIVDLSKPLPTHMVNAYDTVSSHFFAESATDDRDTLVTLLRRIAQLGAPGARIFLSFMRRSVGYPVAGIDFPATPVDEDNLPSILENADFHLDDVEYLVTEAEEPPTRSGYEGMVFVGGILSGAAENGVRRAPTHTGARV